MINIVKRIKELGFDEYAVLDMEGIRYLLVFVGYVYYKETSKDNFSVSPYYFASNRAYFAAKELREFIEQLGYNATVENKIIYDDFLEKCGAVRGDNNLFFIDGLGSLFCVHIIKTDAPLESRILNGKVCVHCKRCIKSCPMGALCSEGIDKDKCIRERMDIVGDEVCRDKISTLLGCDRCQQVCPNNSHIITEASYAQFNKEKMLEGDMSGLAELVGKNMARKNRLMFQALCLTANKGDKNYEKYVKKINNEKLENTKKWCLERLKKY